MPKLRLHKATGQGYVELNGRRIYLGKLDLPETRMRYHTLVAEWEANGRSLPAPADEITIVELLDRFWIYAQGHYRKPDGTPSGELTNYRTVLSMLKELYGHTRSVDFGPRALKAVRNEMIKKGHVRHTVNKNVGRVRSIFRWAVSEELVPPSVLQALCAVAGLEYGRSEAAESERVTPVPETHIEKIRGHVSRQVWAMVQLQLCCGARPGDVVSMRPVDIDTTDSVWLYRPQTHKMSYRGHDRTVYLGPRAQQIVREFLDRPLPCFLFSPREAEADRLAALHEKRKTPLSCGNRPGSNRKRAPRRSKGERYTVNSYRRAIQRACKRVGIPSWHPHQLRHNAGTRIRKEFDIETARVVLGLRSLPVAEVYAEINSAKARDAIEQVG